MDTTRFDELIAGFAQSPTRRGVLRLLGAATFGAGGLAFLADGEAKKRRKKGKKKKPNPCKDGRKNGSESDVDCGGSCDRCGVSKACVDRDDCLTAFCDAGACKGWVNPADCGQDTGGGNCATRVNSDGVNICTKFDVAKFSPTGKCAKGSCGQNQQCVNLPDDGGFECTIPCGA